MKILAIRGENLASLAGPFELDLEAGPLGEAGLLMISGPTGAGKSTILDALCLALFDRTPRLQGRGRKVGFLSEEDREVLNSLDPRCLLRRGAAEGSAEVEFEGVEGRRWRATWSVRRARLKPDGRIQPQTLKLVDAETGIAYGGTKTQTLEAIEEALGLDYDGFCRSVLLAQNEFASFLRATPTEKAALLERVTGTWLYGELSVAAHRRASWARQQVARLEAELDGLTLLADGDRQALEAQRDAARAELAAARAALKQAEAALAWRIELGQREQAEAEAEAAFAAADAAWVAAADERAELAAAEAVQPLRGRLETRDAAHTAQEAAERDAAARAEEHEAAQAALAEAQAATQAAQAHAEAARAAREARAPELDQALALDQQLRQAEAAATEAAAARARQAADAQAAEQAWFALEQEREALATQLTEAEAWLEAHAADAELSAQWPRWERALERLTRLHEALPASEAALTKRRAAAEAAQTAWSAARAEAETARAALEQAEVAWRTEREGPDPRVERAELEERRVVLVELRGLGDRIANAQARGLTAHATAEAARAALAEARERGHEAAAETERLTSLLREAERALELARASLGLAEQRHELVDGSPCPLCGAREHPYAEDLPPFSRFLAEQAERVSALRDDLSTARAAVERSAVEAEHAAAQLVAAQAEETEAAAARQQAEERWLARAWTLGWALGEALIGDKDDLRTQAAATEDRLDALLAETQASLAATRQREEALERAREVVGQRREARAQTREASLQREQEAQAARQALAAAQQARDDQRAALAELQTELDEVLAAAVGAAWRELEPRALADRCRAAAEAHTAARARRAEAHTTLARLTPQLATAQERLEAARTQRAAAEALDGQRAAELAARRTERGAVLDGRPVEGVRAELDRAAREALTAHEAARARLAEASQAAATATARRDSAARAATTIRAAAEARERELAADLAAAGVTLDELRHRLRHDGGWLAAARQRRAALAEARTAAQATLGERSAQRAKHAERGAERGWAEHDRAALEAGVATESDRAAAAEERLRGVAGRLDADARARERAAKLGPTLERERRRAEVWQSLNGLIGSADGKAFRVFAQSLTLELLLEQANAYLVDLAPRYRLQRVRGADLDLQVIDRVMGDEVRAVSSLSGGETFLASLALALGLSSLSAKDTRVDSLFIDEGFGSLDPESQELALATLDALQASGRQVALISHVPGLAERIGVGVKVVPQGQGQSSLQVAAA